MTQPPLGLPLRVQFYASLCRFVKSQSPHPYQPPLPIVAEITATRRGAHPSQTNPTLRQAARESGDTPSARWGLPAWEREGASSFTPGAKWR